MSFLRRVEIIKEGERINASINVDNASGCATVANIGVAKAIDLQADVIINVAKAIDQDVGVKVRVDRENDQDAVAKLSEQWPGDEETSFSSALPNDAEKTLELRSDSSAANNVHRINLSFGIENILALNIAKQNVQRLQRGQDDIDCKLHICQNTVLYTDAQNANDLFMKNNRSHDSDFDESDLSDDDSSPIGTGYTEEIQVPYNDVAGMRSPKIRYPASVQSFELYRANVSLSEGYMTPAVGVGSLSLPWTSSLMNDFRKERFAPVRRIGHPYQNRTPPKRKKPRTSFTRLQILELEKRFESQKYLASTERSALAISLKMTDAQVKTWFQNRRTKWRRQTAEERELERQAANRMLFSIQSDNNNNKNNNNDNQKSRFFSPGSVCLRYLQRVQDK